MTAGATLVVRTHDHQNYKVTIEERCPDCGEREVVCTMCDESLHICAQVTSNRLPGGFRRIPEFPTYMINRQGTIKHIRTNNLALFSRLTKDGVAMVIIAVGKKKFVRAVNDLREKTFGEIDV